MTFKNALAGIAVRNLANAVAWYTTLFDRPPDEQPMPEAAEYRFEGGGWIQLFADEKRAGRSSVTLVVDDLDRRLKDLKAKGIATGAPTRSDYVDTSIINDPDGNQLVLAQARDPSNRAAS